MRSKQKISNPNKHKIPMLLFSFLFGVLFSFGSFLNVEAKDKSMGVVNVNYVAYEHSPDEPDNFVRMVMDAREPGDGFLRMDRAPVNDLWTPELVDAWRVFWMGGDVECLNVVNNRAVIVGQFNDLGEFPEAPAGTLDEYFYDMWWAFELTDNGSGETDTVRQVLETDYETGETYTKDDMMQMCQDGTVGDAGTYPFVGYHSGDIAIYETDRKTFGETEIVETKLKIPDEAGEIEDPGMLNHGCGGLYTLVDGKYKDKFEFTYYPNKAAFEAAAPGSFMKMNVKATFSGLWDNDEDSGNLYYKLKGDKTIKGEAYAWPDGTDLSHMVWEGRFVDTKTKEVTAWWNFDVVNNVDGVASGISDGTCGGFEIWDSYGQSDEEQAELGMNADFTFNQTEDNMGQIPWDHQRIQAEANNVDGYASFRWSDPESPEDTFAETDVHCTQFGRSNAGEADYVNFVGQINSVLVNGEEDESLMGSWYFVQLGRGVDEPPVLSMHNAGIVDQSQAEEMCLEVTPEEIPGEWQTVVTPQLNGEINFFDL